MFWSSNFRESVNKSAKYSIDNRGIHSSISMDLINGTTHISLQHLLLRRLANAVPRVEQMMLAQHHPHTVSILPEGIVRLHYR